jgi:hypothetical protein
MNEAHKKAQIPEKASLKEIDIMAPNSKNDRPSNPRTAESGRRVALTASARTSTVSRDVLGNVFRRWQSGITSNWSAERPDLVLLLEEALAIGDDYSQFDDNDELDEYPSHS